MRIIASDISLQSSRSFASGTRESTNLRVVNGNREINVRSESDSARREASVETSRSIFNDSVDLRQTLPINGNPHGHGGKNTGLSIEGLQGDDVEILDPKLKLTKELTERLLGKKIKIRYAKFETGTSSEQSVQVSQRGPAGPAGPGGPGRAGRSGGDDSEAAPAQGPGGFGLAFDRRVTTYENENTQFSASGSVKTADGKEINFNVDLKLSREYLSVEETSIRAGVLKDPLVLNFNGGSAELSDTRFTFDLDSDGTAEQTHFLKPGSAFLSFDKNQDGTINNGSELFGTESGNGFADLAAYDEDGNNFIDEGDSIYSKLSLYNKTEAGDSITSLKDAGVGAIYLGSAQTEFSLNDVGTNTQKGQIRATGVYLTESGQTGTVQQIDLATEQVETPAAEVTPEAPEQEVAQQEHIDIEG